ncbi:MAG: hypothetical protein U0934_16905, partial [Pseudotabrizicola sp.]|uniref:hypothetical protein n=1 Tax=Pseudotabrizicola sp. TaxID=2939647 RepID=UPI00272F2079
KHPGNRQLNDKRGRPDARAPSRDNLPNPKVATFCAALWLTFTLPLTGRRCSAFAMSGPLNFAHETAKGWFVES